MSTLIVRQRVREAPVSSPGCGEMSAVLSTEEGVSLSLCLHHLNFNEM